MALATRKLFVRSLTALVLLPAVLILLCVPRFQVAFALFVGLMAAIGLYEYFAIVRARSISPETIGGIVAGTLVALSGYFSNLEITNLMLYGGCVMVSALHIVRGQHSVAGLSSSVFGIFYVGWFAAHLILLHRIPGVGVGLAIVLIAAVALSDTGAYFVGSTIGKHKLAPKVSPGKTWEGSAGGLVCALLGMWATHWIKQHYAVAVLPDWTLTSYLFAGAFLALSGQVGDLAESCLKRDAGVKDSGNVFPGHGGVLDRCDGFLFAAPVLYYITTLDFVR